MKTKDLIELLERNGWKFKRHGANHDIYVKDGQKGKRHKAQRNRRRVGKSNHQAARAEISPPPLAIINIDLAYFFRR